MRKYSPSKIDNLDGRKVSIRDVLDREIIVLKHRLMPSKINPKEMTAQVQFKYEENTPTTYIFFTSGKAIINELEAMKAKYKEDFPFVTKIILKTSKNNHSYFTFS